MSRPIRVVLLGDDSRLAARVHRVLRDAGDEFELEQVRSAAAARALLTAWPAHLLLVDEKLLIEDSDWLIQGAPPVCRMLVIGKTGGSLGDHPLAVARMTRAEAGTETLLAHLRTHAPRPRRQVVQPTPVIGEAVLDALPVLVDVRDSDGRFVFVNRERAALHGLCPGDLHGKRPGSVLRGRRLRLEQQRHADALNGPLPLYEDELECADGRLLTLLVSKAPLRTGVGDASHVVTIALDISDRHGYEQRFRHLVEGSLQGIVIDCGLELVFANQAFADMLGYESPAELLAVGRFEELVAPYERERIHGYWDARLRGESPPTVYEFDAVRKDGQHVHLLNHLRVISWRGERAAQSSLLDITARRHAEEALRAERDRAQTYLDVAGVMLLALDTSGRIALINRRGCEVLGYGEEELIGRNWFDDFIPEELRGSLRRAFDKCTAEGVTRALRYENDVLCADGSRKTIAWSNTLLRDAEDNVTGTLSSGEDITLRLGFEAELQRSRRRLQQLYDDNPSMLFTLGNDLRVLSANTFGAEQLGYNVDELLGQPASLVFAEEPAGELRLFVDSCFAAQGEVQHWEGRIRRRDGDPLWVRVSGRTSSLTDGDGEPMLLVVCEDITEAHSLSEQLSFQATHDSLTGLVNRHELEKRLRRVIDSARRDASEHALCYLDLDQFKVINDTCGHSAGDELLRQLSTLLPQRVRRRDTLARLGGDEFGVLMEHCSLEQAKRVANGLRRSIAEHRFVWEGNTFAVGVSIGVVPISVASEGVAGVLAAADAACYAAKDRGRNRIHVYHADDAELAMRHGEMRWVARLNTALENDRFTLYAQRIEHLQGGADEGLHYELLLRLPEDDGRISPPGAFLPAAERYGLSPRTDRWVVETALTWLESHPAHMERLSLCSINVSGASLGDEEFLSFLLGVLEAGRVPCDRLCFEVTETAAIANLSAAIRFIGVLKDLGCRFALDDFGSGVSSFAYLKSLPVDFLKIDGVFVKDILTDPIDLAMVRSINDMAHVMGKTTIAEFVESAAILEKLREIGVDFAQGYAVGRPRPMAELE